jgi:UDP-N-acetylglucosamine acyltransferase
VAIHPTAIVADGAQLDPSCEIGPYAVIGPKVKMGPRNTVGSHASVEGDTTLGADNRIFPHAAVGGIPQDLKYAGEPTKLVIGERNVIREFSTIHIGTAGGGGVTRVGNQCLIMANAHVAHDVQLGDGCILANSVGLSGHVIVEDHVIIGGLSGVHQFTRIGRFAFISGCTGVGMDIPPYCYCTAAGERAKLAGINVVGLQRAGYTPDQISRIKDAYKIVFRSKLQLREALTLVQGKHTGYPEVEHFVKFLEGTERGVTR